MMRAPELNRASPLSLCRNASITPRTVVTVPAYTKMAIVPANKAVITAGVGHDQQQLIRSP
jgi:hypothetical protein